MCIEVTKRGVCNIIAVSVELFWLILNDVLRYNNPTIGDIATELESGILNEQRRQCC